MKAFLRAFTKGVKDVIADPKAAIAYVKQRDGIINEALELRRLKLALDATVLTPDARAEGFGDVDGAAPGADGEPGVRRVRHQGARESERGVERQLPAAGWRSATSSRCRAT